MPDKDTLISSAYLLKKVSFLAKPIGVRAVFLPRGAVNHLPKKFSQIAKFFTKQSKRNEGHTMQ